MVSNTYNDYIERFLHEELRIVNKHLPYRQVTLKEIAEMEIPYIVLRDGTKHLIKQREIELLKNIVPKDKWDQLKIPIIIEARLSLGEHVYLVRDPVAAHVISKILNKKDYSIPLTIYGSELVVVRRILRTTSTIVFYP